MAKCLSGVIVTLYFLFCSGIRSLQVAVDSVDSNNTGIDDDVLKSLSEQRLVNIMQSTYISMISMRTKSLENKFKSLLRKTSQLDGIKIVLEELTLKMSGFQHYENVVQKLANRLDEIEDTLHNITMDPKRPEKKWTLYNGIYYHFSSEATTWDNAKKLCASYSLNSRLVSIPSEDVNAFLIRTGKNGIYWTGGTDREKEGDWVWYGSEKEFMYQDWRSGEPNNSDGDGEEHCLLLYTDASDKSHWNDARCSLFKRFICQSNDVK